MTKFAVHKHLCKGTDADFIYECELERWYAKHKIPNKTRVAVEQFILQKLQARAVVVTTEYRTHERTQAVSRCLRAFRGVYFGQSAGAGCLDYSTGAFVSCREI